MHHKAGWYNVTSLLLPPHEPELSRVEKIWAFLRSNKLSNRVFDAHDDILDACADAWNGLTAQPQRIAAIASPPWAQVRQ